ncbi:MAG: hypothetical protein IJN15_00055 [Clostridia bacterium]|nr:hypothetical protein [Clostridia bacterium]
MWEISINNQIITFLLSLVLGCVLCAFYDTFRSIRKVGFNSFTATFISDLVFWIVSGFITFLFLIARTNGAPRGYVFLTALMGFIIFRATLSRFWIGILVFLIKNIVGFLRFIYTWFYRFWDKTTYLLHKLLLKIIKRGKRWLQKLKKLLKYRYNMLYTKRNVKTSRNGDEDYGTGAKKA